MSHTLGPWRIEKYSDATTRDGERIRAANNLVIVNEVWGASLAECTANTLLIHAAPDLLAACKTALEVLEAVQADEEGADQMPWVEIQALQAAIEKATQA